MLGTVVPLLAVQSRSKLALPLQQKLVEVECQLKVAYRLQAVTVVQLS
jgi:hypothetical protein